jgi:predicted TIM-barrel fold metal-dependent hydrolase
MDTRSAARAIIDCDIHNTVPGAEALFPYLAEYWREYMSRSDFKGPIENYYPAGAATSARPDTAPPGGGPPGSDLALLRAQALDPWEVEYGILNCAYAIESVHNPYAAAAVASAVNDWQIATWLEPEPRLRASLVVPSQHPDLAAQEIERLGQHHGFVQVFLPVRSAAPYGNRRYHPIYAAAVRHNLAIGLHFGGAPGNPPTPTGWPSYYIEEVAGMAQVFQSQLMSLIVEGVFDQFPELRVALIESGVTWLPSLMWRLDKEWKGLRREVPWVKRLPSEYIREHIRLTTQPLDDPPDPRHLQQIIEQLGSDELLMFSTDYPHWQFDTPAEAFPSGLPASLERKVMSENARAFYRLER